MLKGFLPTKHKVQGHSAGPAFLKGFLQQTFIGGFLWEAILDWLACTRKGMTRNFQESTC